MNKVSINEISENLLHTATEQLYMLIFEQEKSNSDSQFDGTFEQVFQKLQLRAREEAKNDAPENTKPNDL